MHLDVKNQRTCSLIRHYLKIAENRLILRFWAKLRVTLKREDQILTIDYFHRLSSYEILPIKFGAFLRVTEGLRGDNHLWPTTRKYTVRCVLFNVLQPNPRGSSMACTATWISTHATKARPLISDTSHNRSNFLRPLRCYSTTWSKHRSTTTCHGATHTLRPT